jgi:hypothetical protein
MAPLRFDRSRIEALLQLAGERLDGEWLLIGGTAAAAWFAPARTTEDLKLIGLGGTQAERFALMDLAVDAAIPIEAVNSVADFFVRRIPGWRDDLVPLVRGSRATIYRPNATLFLLLKAGRLTAVDLDDCLGAIATGEHVDRGRALAALDALPATDDAELVHRRERLRSAITRA